MAGRPAEGLFEEHIEIVRKRSRETRKKGEFWKKYGKPAALVGIPLIGIATYFTLAAGKGKETKIAGEELSKAVNLPKQAEVYTPPDKTETSSTAVIKKEESYGRFTKADFADVIEPYWKRRAGENVDITPEEVASVEKLTDKQLETLYRKQFDVYSEKMSSSEAARRFFEQNGYKRPGWVVWIFIDENPRFDYQQEVVFENIEGDLVVHHRSTLR